MEHVQQLQRKVYIITYDIGQEIQRDLDQREVRIINKIKDDPKAFYGYAKKHSCVRNEISALSTPGHLVGMWLIENSLPTCFRINFLQCSVTLTVQALFNLTSQFQPYHFQWVMIGRSFRMTRC